MTLHRYRWPFAAARASLYLLLVLAIAVLDITRTTDRPPALHATPFPRLNSDIELKLIGDTIFVGREWHKTHAESVQHLRWLLDHNRGSRVIVNVKSEAPFGNVREIMLRARDAGVPHLTIETRHEGIAEHAFRFDATRLVTPPLGESWFTTERLWY
jgi:hypothetical protein